MNVYYYGKQIYQFSYSKPIYEAIGGTFIVYKWRNWLEYKYYLRGMNGDPKYKSFLNTPRVLTRDYNHLNDLKGIMLTHSARRLNVDPQNCRTIYLGHGSGDKVFGGKGAYMDSFDYFFLPGPKMKEKLLDVGKNIPEEKLIKIGNPRFDAVVNGTIKKEKELDRLGVKDRSKPVVLYAPTWRFGNGTFKKYAYKFAEEITKEFNLIIRPHYHDTKRLRRLGLWAKLKGIKNLYFSDSSDLIKADTMLDFVASDLMISDTSSVLYEYLITGKPIIVADNKYSHLHNMPDELNILKHVDLYHGTEDINKMIANALALQKYQKDYAEMLPRIFYFNDGKSTQRAVEYIDKIKKEMA
ncbi:MAG TPA: CDP-glycerol glycerophosphotransferase family protein [Candidatus Cloacimonadota bacterium]|nr:CDP-glycerol glycerophosphotransferase family protein [Candidatus Cloacimonadota bacterium]